tara:strand:- start:57353 stop:58339 length:987 start_codon:yes stop_codon:yes gene_type:complete
LKRETLEQYQVYLYLSAISFGLLAGLNFPVLESMLPAMLWPLLAVLIYTTFTQVPLTTLHQAFSDRRFLTAAVIGNFILLPMVVWLLLWLAPEQPAVQLGIALVLLVPCTDWFVTFTHLGRGDTRHAIAFTPVSLLLQLLLLPVYLWLFLDDDIAGHVLRQELVTAFLGLIVLPLVLAMLTEHWCSRRDDRAVLLSHLAWLPVPLLALVVFCIAAAQVRTVIAAWPILAQLALVFVLFLLAAALLSRLISHWFRLPSGQGRVLAFSLGSRNSFVVLPLALALPASYELTAVVVVFQSLIELVGLAFFVWWVPHKLHPATGSSAGPLDS